MACNRNSFRRLISVAIVAPKVKKMLLLKRIKNKLPQLSSVFIIIYEIL